MHGRGTTMGVPHHKKTLEEHENEWTWTFKSINDTVETKVFVLLKLVFGEGNGTPLQYSCLENPMDGGAW